MRAFLRAGIVVLVVTGLSGCAVTVGSSTSPTPTASRTGSPSPSPSSGASAKVEIGPQQTVVMDASGTQTAVVAYDESPKVAMASLTAALGAAPKIVKDPGDADAWGLGGSDLKWDGLELIIYENAPGDEGHGTRIFQLVVSSPTVNGIPAEGPSHVRVGESLADASAVIDPTQDPRPAVDGGQLPLGHWTRPGDNPDGSGRITDWVVADTSGGKVADLRATTIDYGA